MLGRLFSFEGIDGVGKSTQIEHVRTWLELEGYTVQTVREPGGTAWGEALRDVVLHHPTASRDALAEFLLFASARAALVREHIIPWLTAGHIVLADRYIDSSEAYQGWGSQGDIAAIHQINALITKEAQPQRTIWLDGTPHLPPTAPDMIERRDPSFFRRVHEGYTAIWLNDPDRVARVWANDSPNVVFQHIQDALRSALPTPR